MELRQSISTPDGPGSLRHLDQVAQGEAWLMNQMLAKSLSSHILQGAFSYGHAKTVADQNRGQYYALQQAAAAQGLRIGLDPEHQDHQGYLALLLPNIRATLQHAWGREPHLDRYFPVPQWAQEALADGNWQPRGTDYEVVPPEVTAFLRGEMTTAERDRASAQREQWHQRRVPSEDEKADDNEDEHEHEDDDDDDDEHTRTMTRTKTRMMTMTMTMTICMVLSSRG